MLIPLKNLIQRLGPNATKALESAATWCLSNGHYEIELEHWLLKLLDDPNNHLSRILKQLNIGIEQVQMELLDSLSRFKIGNGVSPTFSKALTDTLESAWTIASLQRSEGKINAIHILVSALDKATSRRRLSITCPTLSSLAPSELFTALDSEIPSSVNDGSLPSLSTAQTSLSKYTINLTEQACQGHIDNIVGRDVEIRQMIDILMRRRQNNPLLAGEPGVGKTAVVEGLAHQIASGSVPKPLLGVQIHTLDMALLQAGAGVKGEFEDRLKSVISEVKASAHPIILFIDEAHTLIGAGGKAGQGDAANLLKPALARGELRTIAATTWAEYRHYFEKDAALTRRFQVIKVEEPSTELCKIMMRVVANKLERHHGVPILNEAIEQAVLLSQRYLPERHLPDKAVSVLDTACAKAAVSHSATPARIQDLENTLLALEQKGQYISREGSLDPKGEAKLREIEQQQKSLGEQLEKAHQQWQQERQIIEKMPVLHPSQNSPDENPLGTSSLHEQLTLQKTLSSIQGQNPMLHALVDAQCVASVISGWTGIPVGRMFTEELSQLQVLEDVLQEKVIGQGPAITALAESIRTAKAGLQDPNKPLGVFLLVGPSGVGKTESALVLAEQLYGGARKLITINLSEFQEAHTVSSLKGAPPGYVGYGQGGVLTDAVRRQPHSVILLDEIEKAHKDVLQIFYQVFDKGSMDDGEGRSIDFSNTIILMTSNLGSHLIQSYCKHHEGAVTSEDLVETISPVLKAHLSPALLARMQVLPYQPLCDDALNQIIAIKLDKLALRLKSSHGGRLTCQPEVSKLLLSRCTEVDSGARNVDHILSQTLLPSMSLAVLKSLVDGYPIEDMYVSVCPRGEFSVQVNKTHLAC